MRPGSPKDGGGAGSTAAVLWLMILLIFLPIAAAHVVARVIAGNAVPTSASP